MTTTGVIVAIVLTLCYNACGKRLNEGLLEKILVKRPPVQKAQSNIM